MASKFSTPFMAKSPLYGAYESGAGGKVHVSNRQAFQKLFDDASSVGSVKKENEDKKDTKNSEGNPVKMLGECPKGKVRSKINKKCVSKKGAGKEYDK